MDLRVRKSIASLMVVVGGKSAGARFEVLIRAHYRALYRTALRLTRSVHDAEDLVQEACVRAFPRLDEIEGLERPHFWFVRVMYRVFIDSRRRYERRNVESFETSGTEPFSHRSGSRRGDRRPAAARALGPRVAQAGRPTARAIGLTRHRRLFARGAERDDGNQRRHTEIALASRPRALGQALGA